MNKIKIAPPKLSDSNKLIHHALLKSLFCKTICLELHSNGISPIWLW